jgi:hypothetical protein
LLNEIKYPITNKGEIFKEGKMKKYNSLFYNLIYILRASGLLIVFSFSNLLQAQNDSWISQTITPISFYNYYYASADECCAFVCDNKASIYFFDIKSSQWTEYQIPNNEQPNLLTASDDVLLAVCDSSIIGYSSITQQINFRRFEGNPVNFNYYGQFQSYACYGKFAAFLTDENLYVFDAEIGSWQVRNYSLPPNFYPNGQLYIKDDYLLVIFNNSVYAHPINIVYNLLQHDFYYISESVYILEPMDHGFAGRYGAGFENYYIGGYSVYTNNFISSNITNQGDIQDGGPYRNSKVIGECTTYCIQFLKGGSPPNTLTNLYAYDTKNGNWINWNMYGESNPSPPLFGGKLSVSWWPSDDIFACVVFDGINNNFFTLYPYLVWNYNDFHCGGKLLIGLDSLKLWGYDISNQSQSSIITPFYNRSNFAVAENFISFCGFSYFQDIMDVYFYNGYNNSWKIVQTWKATSDYCKVSKNVYNLTVVNPGYTESQITFYSPILDSVVQLTQSGQLNNTVANNFLSYSAFQSKSYFFDARNARVDEFNFNFSYPGLTDTAAFFLDQSANTLYGYSSISKSWTNFQPAQIINQREIKKYIGIAASVGQSKVYAYNSFKDRFTEFTPTGSTKTLSVGGKTALLIRNDIIYAYDPEVITGIVETDERLINYQLFQNYPNPFNPSTVISYYLPISSNVTLKVYDILGNEVATLVDEYKLAGKYEVEFKSTVGCRQLASGIYFYQLRSGSFVQMKKMILLK